MCVCACVRACVRACVCVCVCDSFSFGFVGRVWDLIVFVPDHYLSFLLREITSLRSNEMSIVLRRRFFSTR